jgi:hypothetical protein
MAYYSAWGVWKVEVENMRGAEKGMLLISVSDPHPFFADPDPDPT